MKLLDFHRSWFALSFLSLAGTAEASGALGTRPGGGFEPMSTGGGLGIAPLIQMLVALGIVAFLLKWLLPKIAGKWFQPKVPSSKNIKVLESVPVGSALLHLVEIDGARILLASHSQGASMLTVISSESNLSSQRSLQSEVTLESKVVSRAKKQGDYRVGPNAKSTLADGADFESILEIEKSTPPIKVPNLDAQNALSRLESLTL